MNNSFQQNNSGSSRKRVTAEASNYDLSINKTEQFQVDTSLKKLNATASYDIIAMHEESNEFDQSYGRLVQDGFPSSYKGKLSIRSPNNMIGSRNMTNQSHNTTNSIASQSMSNLKQS